MIISFLATWPIFEHFSKKVNFSLWKTQNTFKIFTKLVLDIQNIRHIAQNASHTAQNDGRTMQNIGRTMRNVSCNTLNVCMDGLKGLQVKVFVPEDVSMDSNINIFTYNKMINLKIFGRTLSELWLHWWILLGGNLHYASLKVKKLKYLSFIVIWALSGTIVKKIFEYFCSCSFIYIWSTFWRISKFIVKGENMTIIYYFSP